MDTWIEVDKNGIGWEVTHHPNQHHTVYGHDRTIYRQLPANIHNFCCPICGSESFTPIYESPKIRAYSVHDVIGPGPNAGLP